MTTQPRCSHCHALGIRTLARVRIDRDYFLYYCRSCGTIHSIVPDLDRLAAPPPEPVSYFDEEPTEPPSPRCPHHNLPLYRVTVPEGYREAGREFLVCPKKAECKYYQPVEADEPHEARAGQPEPPRPSVRPATQDAGRPRSAPKRKTGPDRVSIFTDRTAMIDVARRAAEKSRKMTPNQIGAMAHGGGGFYQHTLVAPLCPQHQVAMELVVVPGGYADAGERFWFCPHIGECGRWDTVRPDERKVKK